MAVAICLYGMHFGLQQSTQEESILLLHAVGVQFVLLLADKIIPFLHVQEYIIDLISTANFIYN
jgi:hypothetical protein